MFIYCECYNNIKYTYQQAQQIELKRYSVHNTYKCVQIYNI